MGKKTLVIGASENPERYAYKAIHKLTSYDHETVAVGLRNGETAGVKFHVEQKMFSDLDSVTLYVSPKNQISYKEYILNLKPKRVIFNPGTENPDFYTDLEKAGIEVTEACTLVMLSIGNY
jgi:predicted CoA-binding protein